jgi:hypothetical protein
MPFKSRTIVLDRDLRYVPLNSSVMNYTRSVRSELALLDSRRLLHLPRICWSSIAIGTRLAENRSDRLEIGFWRFSRNNLLSTRNQLVSKLLVL